MILCKDCVVKCQNGFDYVLVKKTKKGWIAFPAMQAGNPETFRTYTTIKEEEIIQ